MSRRGYVPEDEKQFRVLERLEGVVSGDAIILNQCKSWLNMMPAIVEQIDSVWKIQL